MTTPEVIVFPDVEALLCGWLTTQLAQRDQAVPVSTQVPSPRPAKFLRVMRTGGPVGGLFVTDNPTITTEAWAASETDAVALIQLARGLINSLPGQSIDGIAFYRVSEFSGPANLPDPTTSQIRYTQSTSILLRGTAA